MNLRIVTPLSIVLDQTIVSLRAEDASGGFGILADHAPFLTALAVSILSWRTPQGHHFCAVRGGVLTVDDQSNVDIATREAVLGDDLANLDRHVLARFQSDADAERTEHSEAMRLQFNAIRHMVSRLKPGAASGAFQ